VAKRTYKILRFDGGINNDADPRDIGDNQFADLQNVAVDEMGKIIVLGDVQTERKPLSGILTGAGNGLFACTTDHDGLLTGGVELPGQTYYLVENADTINGIGEDGETATIACTIGSAGPTMYYVDGALRIADADHAGGTVPVWRGFIEAKTYGPASTGADATIVEQWSTENAEIAGAFPTFDFGNVTYCSNAFVINEADSTAQAYDLYNDTAELAAYTDGTANTGASGMKWGVALEFDEDANGTGTWMPQDTIRYKFFITTMYDNHTQESLPQLMMLWPSTLLHASNANEYDNKEVQPEMAFTNDDDHEVDVSNPAGENVAVYFRPAFKVNNDTATTYTFGASAVGATSGGNPRISGVRIYWASNEDGYTTLWQMVDSKFDEGIKLIGADGGGGGTSGYGPMVELNSNTFSTSTWTSMIF